MRIFNIIPVVVTNKFEETKAFYVNYFDFEIVFEEDGFVDLISGGGEEFVLSFIDKNAQSIPEKSFDGNGLHYMIEVEDIDEEYSRLVKAGLKVPPEITFNAQGERHFTITDPNGILLNIFSLPDEDDEHEIHGNGNGNGNGNYL
ncbi:VOC family protein [bacterium]|nr:VOC family protein [bacterium]